MIMQHIVLASTSPRRKELLATAGYQFEVIAPSPAAECGLCSQEMPPEFAARMAYQKAKDVVLRLRSNPAERDLDNTIIIGCDTIAECTGQILGKPQDASHARTILKLLSGREHHVYSGLCVWHVKEPHPQLQVECTKLFMEPFSETQLDEYLASGLWEGKAGAFGYQDRPGWLRILQGSESNVVGLPMELLSAMIKVACQPSHPAHPPALPSGDLP
jgi:septum formation protein